MDSLDNLLTSLQLQPPTNQSLSQTERFDKFTLFPTLPTEIRLKILSHALPTHTTLRLTAHVLVADPTFGLYLTFTPTHPPTGPLRFLSANFPQTPSLKSTRQLSILLVNKEFREFYLQQLPLTLPNGTHGVGQVRYARSETVFVSNFEELMKEHDFARAIMENWRLQNWWMEIESLGVPVTALILRVGIRKVRPAAVVGRFGKLRKLKVYMWEGFDEQVADEVASKAVKGSMEVHLGNLRRELEVSDMGEGYVVPKIGLV